MERITSTIVEHGETGTTVRIRSGNDYREDETLGPVTISKGMVGGVSWKQNANGETIVNTAEPVEPVDDPVITSVEHVREPFERYVISKVNSLGNGTREYVDPLTWQIIRSDKITPTETTTSRFGSFAGPLGYFRAWRTTKSDGHPENDSTETIQSDVATNVTPAMLAIPQSRRVLVAFPRGHGKVDLPVMMVPHRDRFIVRVMIGTRGVDMLLDTGCSGIVIDQDVAQSLGLRLFAPRSDASNGGRYVSESAIVPEMDAGDLTMRDVIVETIPHVSANFAPGVKIVGLLGFDFLAQINAKLDYANGAITVYDPASFVPPTGPRVVPIDVRLGRSLPELPLTINGALGNRFVLDTGGIGGTLVFDYFRRKHTDALVDAHNHPQKRGLIGVGGNIDTTLLQIARLKIGTIELHDVNAFVNTTAQSYSADFDGIVGSDVLRQFTVYLDYPHQRVYLEPI